MKTHGGETRCPRARTWRAEPRLVSCGTWRQTTKRGLREWGKQSKIRERSKVRHRSQISLCPKRHCSCIVKCLQKNHPEGCLEPISLLRECQISMNLTPLAKISCTNDNTQRHTPAPHLPQNYALKTFQGTAVIGLKNWLQLPFRWISNLTCNSNFGSSVLRLLCQIEMLMPCRQHEKQAAQSLWNTESTWNENQDVTVHLKATEKGTTALGKMNSCTSTIKCSIS